MGSSSWAYRVPHQEDMQLALIALQHQELTGGRHLWREEEAIDPQLLARFPGLLDGGAQAVPPRPTTLEQLAAIKNDDRYRFWTWGTHSILDLDHLVAPDDEDSDGTLRPLSDNEVVALFGSERPSVDDFDALHAADQRLGLTGSTWSGRCTVLYRDGQPDQLAFWGRSGD